MLPRHWFRWRRCLSFLPITGLFTEYDELAVRSGTAMYSTCPSCSTFEVQMPLWPKDALDDGEPALCAPSQRSLVSREAFRRILTFCWHYCQSDTTCWLYPSPNTDYGLISSLTMTLSATTTAFFSIATPLSEKKLFCVNKKPRTRSWTQVMTLSFASRLKATRSESMLNGAPRLLARLRMSAENWKTWTKQGIYGKEPMTSKSTLDINYLVKMTTSPKSS